MKKIILSIILVMMFSTSAFAYKTKYTERSTETYQFVLKVAVDIYNINIVKRKPTEPPIVCALKAINLCTTPFCGASTGITDVEKQEMALMLEEDLLRSINR